MKKVAAFIVIFLLINTTQAQVRIYEDQAINDVYNWLKGGNYKFDIQEKDIPPTLQKIIDKYRKTVTQNSIWYNNYKNLYKNAKPLPYHENFGITQAEYDKMNKEFPLLKMRTQAVKKIQVTQENGEVHFKDLDGFNFFNQILIDNNKYTLMIDTGKALFKGQVTEEASLYGNYIGYKWFYETGDIRAHKNNEAINYLSIELIFSKTIPDGKILIEIKALMINKSAKIYDVSVAGYMVPEGS